jgi:hypothetical protein
MNESNSGMVNGDHIPNLNIYDPNQPSYPGQTVIGICSVCGGDVVQYSGPWYGSLPPATCVSCGATERQDRGPVIPMVPTRRRYGLSSDDGFVPPWEPFHLAVYIHDQVNTGHSEAMFQPESLD